ncbi:MAG: hypothetical protein ABIZ04_11680 [Opitutus sp.]
MLRTFFQWFDLHPEVYWIIASVPTIALIAMVASSIWVPRPSKTSRTDWIFCSVLFLFVAASRWPVLLAARDLNQDEGQLIAGALTLIKDPVFWRSVDGTTSGPLNYYVLLPVRLLGLPLDYFGARFVGLILVSIALLASYRLLYSYGSRAAARLGILAPAAFFATVTHDDFTHYSSEHVSLALFAVAAFAILRRPRGDGLDRRLSYFGWFVAGLLPWAKLQSAPLAAVLVGFAIWKALTNRAQTLRERGRATAVIVGVALLPSCLALVAILLTGQFEPFWQGYVVQNFVYVQEGVSLTETIRKLAVSGSSSVEIPAFLLATIGLLAICTPIYLRSSRRAGQLFVIGAVCTAVALSCILAPRRAFAHYLLLLIIPLALWSGGAVTEIWSAVRWRRRTGLLLVVVGGLVPLVARVTQPVPPPIGRLAENWRRPYSVPSTLLRAYCEPGEALGVWGWRTDLYVETETIQATRDPHVVWSIQPSPAQGYYRARYLADLKRNRPRFFVDAVGVGAMAFEDRATQGHECLPELAHYIRTEYLPIADLGLERIYVRRGATALAGMLSVYRVQGFVNQSRRPVDVDAPEPERLDPPNMSGWDFNGQGVRALQPPASVTWALNGKEREVLFEYGFHPRAYHEGRSNGADFIVEIHHAGDAPRRVFQRHLDPARVLADRGPLKSRVTLPPFAPDSRLVVRTEAGEFNDAAWDWVYLAPPKYLRQAGFTQEQFPNFNFVPDEAEANHSTVLEDPRVKVLLLNTPSRLTYGLDGTETRLRFSYGVEILAAAKAFEAGAARYSVKLRRGDEPVRVIFERMLQPRESREDRLRQFVQLELQQIRAGDQLSIEIDAIGETPTTGNYITDFFLE